MTAPGSLSLGWRTDLIFAAFGGEIIERPDCLVVRTPGNPGFWWGNFVLFDRAPADHDLEPWMARFETEIERLQPGSRHRAFAIDHAGLVTLPTAFARAGFVLERSTVLAMSGNQLGLPAPPCPPGFSLEVLDLTRHAREVVALRMAVDKDANADRAGHLEFVRRKVALYAAMQAAGRGHWLGVRSSDASLVASCGLFREAEPSGGLGRFQTVSTHPRWRRRGLCRALVHAACRHGFETMGLTRLVIVADPDDVAIGLYESIGFMRGTSTWQLERPPSVREPEAERS